MGCGQSKIGIYQRKSKNKKNGSKRSGENGEKDGETEEGEDTINSDGKDTGSLEKGDSEEADPVTEKLKQMAQQQTGGTVLAQSDISSSQLDFFKMLDEKIENGPDYEESDEEEQKARMANLVQEWKNACLARQQKKAEATEQEKGWFSPGRGGKLVYQDDYNYPGKRVNVLVAQRFPTAYPAASVNSIHIHNSYKMNPPHYVDQSRMQPRIPIIGNYHPYQPPSESFNHCDATTLTGHPMSAGDPINPLRPQVLLRQSSITSQVQHYPENQRLYPETIRQFSDFSRPYHDQRPYQISRNMPSVNVLYEHRMGPYGSDMNIRPQQTYSEDSRQCEEVQRIMMDLPRQYSDPQRPLFGNVDEQRLYHERLLEKQRQYSDGARSLEGPRPPISFQKPPLLTQRSFPDPPSRVYRDLENDDSCFSRQESFSGDLMQEGSTYRPFNPSHFKGGRSLSVEVHYLAGPPPPREVIPLQGAPGPPQGSPRPRGLQPNMHRLPANSVVHFRKPQGAFT